MSTDSSSSMCVWTDPEYTYFAHATKEALPKLLADYSLCGASFNQHITVLPPFVIRRRKTNRPSIWTKSEGSALQSLKKIRPDEAIRFAELRLEEFVLAENRKLAIDKVIHDSLNRNWYGSSAESGEEVAVYPDVSTSLDGLTVTYTSFYRRMPTIPIVSRSTTVRRGVLERAGV